MSKSRRTYFKYFANLFCCIHLVTWELIYLLTDQGARCLRDLLYLHSRILRPSLPSRKENYLNNFSPAFRAILTKFGSFASQVMKFPS